METSFELLWTMEIISSKQFVILTLATSILLASKPVCAHESVMSNLRDWEHYDEYLKPIGHPNEKKQRSLHLGELPQWGSISIHKLWNQYKIPQPMPHPPLRFGRSFEEVRNVESLANLPLRFGRNFDGGISRRIPNLPQRFGRAAVKSIKESITNMPQSFQGSPSAEQINYSMGTQPEELRTADEGEPRTLDFDDYFTKKADDNEVNEEAWEVWREVPPSKRM